MNGPERIALKLSVDLPGFRLALDLDLPGRGVTGLFGPSGSGKSTCLRAIAGLARARGRLVVCGETWQDDAQRLFVAPHRRALGYVFQHAALFPHLDVRGNVLFAHRRVPTAARRVDVDQVVELLGLEPLLSRRVDGLSGGERQRVALARAVAGSPRLLLLDEPLAALDVRRRGEILPYLQRLQAQLDIPTVYVSHAPEEVARLADHVVLLEAGRAVASGPTAQMLTRMDLTLAHGDTAQAVLPVTVVGHDAQDHLTRVRFSGGDLWLPALDAQPGARRVVRVMARDVSLTLSRQTDTSILNVLPATVRALDDDGPGHAMVQLDAGGDLLLARITRRSVANLGLVPGQAVFVQVKGGAIV